MTQRGERGFTLLETLVGLFLIGLGVLAVAPMFMMAMEGNDTGGDLGQIGAIAVDRMEQLRELDYDDTALDIGGDLTANFTHPVSGLDYFDLSNPGHVVRWRIEANAAIPLTKAVTVRVIDVDQTVGPRRTATMTTLRGE